MRSLSALAALAALAVLACGCTTAPPKPTGAGSTPVLCLLRDWRGVWSGPIKDSPMGPMTYTLWVEDLGEYVRLTSAPMREAGLDTIHHVYKLVEFDRGVPYIEYALSQRNTTQKGTVVYREGLSSDEAAVFCAEEGGCDRVRFTITQTDDQHLTFNTMVAEAGHAEWTLKRTTREIPKDRTPEVDRPEPPKDPVTPAKPAPKFDEDGNPLDTDLYLQDNPDQDVGASKVEPKGEKKEKKGPRKK